MQKLLIGRVVKPQGIKGEVKVLTLNGVRISLNALVISEIEINGLKYSVTEVAMTSENGETTVSFK